MSGFLVARGVEPGEVVRVPAFGLPKRERRGRWMARAVRRHPAGDDLCDGAKLLGAVDRLFASGEGAGALTYWLGFEMWRRVLCAASR